jgi:hypothetical protein
MNDHIIPFFRKQWRFLCDRIWVKSDVNSIYNAAQAARGVGSRNRFLRHANHQGKLCYRLAASYTGRGNPPVFLGSLDGGKANTDEEEGEADDGVAGDVEMGEVDADRECPEGRDQREDQGEDQGEGEAVTEPAEIEADSMGQNSRKAGMEQVDDVGKNRGEVHGAEGVSLGEASEESEHSRLWGCFQNSWVGIPRENDSSALMTAFSELRLFFAANGPLLTYTIEAFDHKVFNALGSACSADGRFGRLVGMAAVTLSLKILLGTHIDILLPKDRSLAQHIVEKNRDRFEEPTPFATCLRQAIERCQRIWDAAFYQPGGSETDERGMTRIDAILSELTRLVLRFRSMGQELVFYNPGNVVISAIARTFPSWEAEIGDLDVHLNMAQGLQDLLLTISSILSKLTSVPLQTGAMHFPCVRVSSKEGHSSSNRLRSSCRTTSDWKLVPTMRSWRFRH